MSNKKNTILPNHFVVLWHTVTCWWVELYLSEKIDHYSRISVLESEMNTFARVQVTFETLTFWTKNIFVLAEPAFQNIRQQIFGPSSPINIQHDSEGCTYFDNKNFHTYGGANIQYPARFIAFYLIGSLISFVYFSPLRTYYKPKCKTLMQSNET